MGSANFSHPSPEELRSFMRGELQRSEVRHLVRHLLTGCPECLEVTRRLWDLGERSLRVLEAISACGSGLHGAERVQRKARLV